MTFAREAWPFVLPPAAAAAVLAALRWWAPAAVAAVAALAILAFFRVPRRQPAGDDEILLSAANGRVIKVDRVAAPELGPGSHQRVATFLSVFNVHLQRAPTAGEVVLSSYRPGPKLAAFRAAAADNESHLTAIRRADGEVVGVRQIAGLLARRIVCYLEPRAAGGGRPAAGADQVRLAGRSADSRLVRAPGRSRRAAARRGDGGGAPAELAMKKRRRVRRRLRRGTYLLPSLFTIGNILLGFYALICGLRGDFQRAALLIFAAALLDALDGRIARLTGTESDFGREFDSLADVLTFGATPAVLTYLWGLRDLGRIGWLVPLCYLVCTATRLARFNVQTRLVDGRYFVGLPAPAAACALASILFFAPTGPYWRWGALALLLALLCLGGLMVSTFRYWSPKRIDLRQRWSYRMILPVAAVLLVVAYHPPAFFLALALLYTLSAPTLWLWARWRPPATSAVPAEPARQSKS